MTTVGQSLQDLARSEQDLLEARAILDCLANADACPAEWVEEYDRLRAAHLASGQSLYGQITQMGAEIEEPQPVAALSTEGINKSSRRTTLQVAMLRSFGMPRSSMVALRTAALTVLPASKLIWWEAAAIAAGVGAYFVAQSLREDPGAAQVREQAAQYRDFVGMVTTQMREGMLAVRQGRMTAAEYNQLIANLRSVCPDAALPALPGVQSCGLSSCQRWFLAGFLVSAALVALAAWSKSAGVWQPKPWVTGGRARALRTPKAVTA